MKKILIVLVMILALTIVATADDIYPISKEYVTKTLYNSYTGVKVTLTVSSYQSNSNYTYYWLEFRFKEENTQESIFDINAKSLSGAMSIYNSFFRMFTTISGKLDYNVNSSVFYIDIIIPLVELGYELSIDTKTYSNSYDNYIYYKVYYDFNLKAGE